MEINRDYLDTLKHGILAQLAVSGSAVVVHQLEPRVVRAVAELIIDDCVYDAEDPHGNLMLVITARGLKEAKP